MDALWQELQDAPYGYYNCMACGYILPQFDQIKNKLKECGGQQVLLLSVGEYLRLCMKRELNPDRCQFRAFWETQQPEASTTRIVIPVFSCRDTFDRIIGAIDERQKDYVWALDSTPSAERNFYFAYGVVCGGKSNTIEDCNW